MLYKLGYDLKESPLYDYVYVRKEHKLVNVQIIFSMNNLKRKFFSHLMHTFHLSGNELRPL